MAPPRRCARLIRVLALAALVAGFLAFVRASNAEASAIFRAGGDAGMWDLGLVFAAMLLAPGVVLLLLAHAADLRTKGTSARDVAAGAALLAATTWLGATRYPPVQRTEGRRIDPVHVGQVADLYLIALVLLGAAGALLFFCAYAACARKEREELRR